MSDLLPLPWATEHYDRLLAELRHQIDRQWDHVKFFILLNASGVAGALTLLQAGDGILPRALALLVFAGGIGLAVAGTRVLSKNKVYYRTLVAKKVLMEHSLGLTRPFPRHEESRVATLAVGALATRDKIEEIVRDPDAYVSPRLKRGSLSDWAWWTLTGFALIDLAGLLLLANALASCLVAALCSPA